MLTICVYLAQVVGDCICFNAGAELRWSVGPMPRRRGTTELPVKER